LLSHLLMSSCRLDYKYTCSTPSAINCCLYVLNVNFDHSFETHVVFDSGLFLPLCEYTTLSAKLEVHSISHCHQRKTESRSHVTCTENSVMWFLRQMNRQTNKQTDTLVAILHTPTGPYRARSNERTVSVANFRSGDQPAHRPMSLK